MDDNIRVYLKTALAWNVDNLFWSGLGLDLHTINAVVEPQWRICKLFFWTMQTSFQSVHRKIITLVNTRIGCLSWT